MNTNLILKEMRLIKKPDVAFYDKNKNPQIAINLRIF